MHGILHNYPLRISHKVAIVSLIIFNAVNRRKQHSGRLWFYGKKIIGRLSMLANWYNTKTRNHLMRTRGFSSLCFGLIVAGFCLTSAALCAAADTERKTNIDVIIVAGQSNAVGFNAKPGEMPPDSADKNILFWWRCGDPLPDEHDSTSNNEWKRLQAQPRGNPEKPPAARAYGNFAENDGGFGPEIGLARTLYAKEKQPLAIIKVAFSGTSLAGDWLPVDQSANSSTGACYRSLVDECRLALAALAAQGFTPRLRAFAWIQGESDAAVSNAPWYETNLTNLITKLRSKLNAPDMAVLLCLNAKFKNASYPKIPEVIAAQKTVAAKMPRAIYVDTTAASIANAAHFDSAGTLAVGKWLTEALWKIESAK
jgi:hypothetical protein